MNLHYEETPLVLPSSQWRFLFAPNFCKKLLCRHMTVKREAVFCSDAAKRQLFPVNAHKEEEQGDGQYGGCDIVNEAGNIFTKNSVGCTGGL